MSQGRRRRVFNVAWFRRDHARDLEDELAFHFQRTVEGLVDGGWSEADARREARRRFGDRARYVAELERIDRGRVRMEGLRMWISDRWADLRLAFRTVRRQPGFAAAVVVTFALGIGANAALFGIVDRLLLRPPAHVVEPEEVVRLQIRRSFLDREITGASMAWDDYQDFTRVSGFTATAPYMPTSLTLGEGETARRVAVTYAGHELFPLLGVHPFIGRFYGPDDDAFGAPLVAVLGYELWRGQFGADPGVLGSTIKVAGATYTVVGVAPRGFTGVHLNRVDLWIPARPGKVATDGSDVWFSTRGYQWVRAVARRPAEGEAAALEQATALHRAGREEEIAADRYDPEVRIVASAIVTGLGGDGPAEGRVALWLAGVSFVVLLIACANVANLLLARSLRQQRESAVRLALGVSPRRLVQQRVLDALVLALLGGGVGLAVAFQGGALLRQAILPQIDWTGATDGRVLIFTLGVTLLAGLASAVAPAVMAARQRLGTALAQGGRGSRTGARVRGFLSLGQAALATLLLVGAGLFVRSLGSARQVDLGFDVDHVLAVDLEASAALETPDLKDYYGRAAERAAALPGVRAAAATNAPFGWSFSTVLRAEGLDSLPRSPTGGPYYHRVTDGYFEAAGLRVLRGRGLERGDYGGEPVAVINETMAELLWPGEDPLGRCLWQGPPNEDPPCMRVVGVTAYAHRGGFSEERSAQYYLPMADDDGQAPRGLLVRVAGDPEEAAPGIVRALLADLPGVRLVQARPMRTLLDPEFRGWRLGTTVFTLFGILALVVAGVGLYSLLAFDVAERRREIGIRMAVGASASRIHTLVLRRAMALAGAGVALGLLAAFLLAPRAADLLYQVSPRDPVLFALAGLVLLAAGGIAGALPARRATRVDPTEALRAE